MCYADCMAFGRPGEQLRLFAPADEMVQSLGRGDLGSHELINFDDPSDPPSERTFRAANALMNTKKDEAYESYDTGEHGSGVYDSIRKHGFRGHVALDVSEDQPRIWEGHHRLGAAHDLGEQFVGLDYIDPSGSYGPPERHKPSYGKRYPQNISDEQWSGGVTYDGPSLSDPVSKIRSLFS